MKIVTWNLNHRTIEKPISDNVLKFFSIVEADVVALNEFVDGPTRSAFREKLRELGYKTANQIISAKRGKQNQVFIASKSPIPFGRPPTSPAG